MVGDNRKLLIFPLADVPELARGQGVFLQKYKEGGLTDATSFVWKDGLKDANGRLFMPSDLKDWRGSAPRPDGSCPMAGHAHANSADELSCGLVNQSL